MVAPLVIPSNNRRYAELGIFQVLPQVFWQLVVKMPGKTNLISVLHRVYRVFVCPTEGAGILAKNAGPGLCRCFLAKPVQSSN
mmetsp:Transcript_11030/g.24702  ORF Transcript_11030/g.24702 Transcript_11030/m.24702 type:complete len:83 (+) Transcript_11030:999-1247(+)